jgi:hypothetical protein
VKCKFCVRQRRVTDGFFFFDLLIFCINFQKTYQDARRQSFVTVNVSNLASQIIRTSLVIDLELSISYSLFTCHIWNMRKVLVL